MIRFDGITRENIEQHNSNSMPQILDHPCRTQITGGSGSRETNAILTTIRHQLDIDKMYLYAKHPNETKHKRQDIGLKHYNDSKAFIEQSNVYENIEE